MKRFIARAPVHLARGYKNQQPPAASTRLPGPDHLRIHPAVMDNVTLNSDILKSLQMQYYKVVRDTHTKTTYLLITPEIRAVLIPGNPITTLGDWRAHVEHVLAQAIHYPPDVHSALLAECKNLVYEPPSSRRELLEHVMSSLITSGYPITVPMYTTYLNTIQAMKQNVDMSKVFRELTDLKMSLSYVKYENMELADVVCYFLGLNADTQHIYECWKSFQAHRAFRGFRDKTFAAVVTGHVMRGEYDEVFELLHVLQHHGLLGAAFCNHLADSAARVGNLEVLDSLIRKMGHVDKFLSFRSLQSIYLELVENNGDEYIPKLLDTFVGFNVEYGRVLEMFTCDVLSRGHYSRGADLVVYGQDGFQFNNKRQRGIFKKETLHDITTHMTDTLDNILIRLELRGLRTKHTFDFSKVNISTEELDRADEVGVELTPQSDQLIQQLYQHVQNSQRHSHPLHDTNNLNQA